MLDGLWKFLDWIRYGTRDRHLQRHFPAILERELLFRPMRKYDIPQVAEIEGAAYPFPWSEATFHDCFTVNYDNWVGEFQGDVVAYGILSAYLDEAHILNVCVSPLWQRRGFGRQMMHKLIEEAGRHGARTLFLEVRPSNRPALLLYGELGFNEVGLRRNYYPAPGGQREDGLLLALALGGEN